MSTTRCVTATRFYNLFSEMSLGYKRSQYPEVRAKFRGRKSLDTYLNYVEDQGFVRDYGQPTPRHWRKQWTEFPKGVAISVDAGYLCSIQPRL
ncbi:hypothetical protein KQX54_017223 [Cotesia glomerata]|uniref:Uncharacterized protein n=1 Tax=Cotesia glomerata TaxID=32391 RepID=A0AAV7IE93_COTGL|nr:hypothetical protein KQX54_017223 [Cotesia glomerata]